MALYAVGLIGRWPLILMSGGSSNRSYSSILRSSTRTSAHKYAKDAMKKAIIDLCQNFEREFHEPVHLEFQRSTRGKGPYRQPSSKHSSGLHLKELVHLQSQVLSDNSRSSKGFSPSVSPHRSSPSPQMVDMIKKSSNCIDADSRLLDQLRFES
jgi:hypothetical protein